MEMNKRIKNNQQEKLNITSGSRDISRMPVGISKYEMSEIDKLSFNQGFQKGKLEQKKEELEYWEDVYEQGYTLITIGYIIKSKIRQLQKEIGRQIFRK